AGGRKVATLESSHSSDAARVLRESCLRGRGLVRLEHEPRGRVRRLRRLRADDDVGSAGDVDRVAYVVAVLVGEADLVTVREAEHDLVQRHALAPLQLVLLGPPNEQRLTHLTSSRLTSASVSTKVTIQRIRSNVGDR